MRIKYPEEWAREACAELDAMFSRARKEKLWFFHGGISGPLWFSPDELQAQQENGKYVWTPVNWELRKPQEEIDRINKHILASIEHAKSFAQRAGLTPPTWRTP